MRRRLLAASALLLLALLAVQSQTTQAAPRLSGVHYAAGWNIVAAPTGSLLPGATNPYFAFGPGSTAYQSIAPGAVVGGRAVWAYFPSPTDVPLGASAAAFARVLAPPDQWVLIGNPSTSVALPLNGADAAVAYMPSQGYVSVEALQPGQGAWVLRFQGGTVSVGTAGSAASELARLQAAVTADPSDRSTLNSIAATTSELLQSRQYDQVQTAIDDLWSASADGLEEHGALAVAALSDRQRAAASEIREQLALAYEATQADDLAGADRAVEKAKTTAQVAADDGVEIARGQGSGEHSLVFASAAGERWERRDTATNLAAYGALLHAAFFSIALGQAPSDDLWSVATTLISGIPVPQAAGSSPPLPPALSPETFVNCEVDVSLLGMDPEELQALQAINAYRLAQGLQPLHADYLLTRIALWKATALLQVVGSGGESSHDDGFRSYQQRMQDCGYTRLFPEAWYAENLGYGQLTGSELATFFIRDPAHSANMLEPNAVAVGLKRVQSLNPADRFHTYWALELGDALDQALPMNSTQH